MTDFTTGQIITIAIIFGIGLILGLALRSGGTKWRIRYEAERQAHAALRRDYDAHLARHREATPVEHATLHSGSF